MWYFRKLWIVPESILLIIWAICKYVVPYLMNFTLRFLWRVSSDLPFDVTDWFYSLKNLNPSLEIWESKLFTVLVLISVVVLIWLVVNLITGQLVRDVKSSALSRHLIRSVNDNSTNINSVEQIKANKWIKRLRFVQHHRKLVLIIPCGGNASVGSIIEDRCNKYVNKWLVDNFTKVKWVPIQQVHRLWFSWILVKEK